MLRIFSMAKVPHVNTLSFHNPVFVKLRRIFSHVIPRYSEALLSVSSLVILPEFRTVSEGSIGSRPHSSLTTRIKSLSTSGCPVKRALILILMWGLPVVSAAASIFRCIPKQRWWSINCPIYGGLEGALLKFAATFKKNAGVTLLVHGTLPHIKPFDFLSFSILAWTLSASCLGDSLEHVPIRSFWLVLTMTRSKPLLAWMITVRE